VAFGATVIARVPFRDTRNNPDVDNASKAYLRAALLTIPARKANFVVIAAGHLATMWCHNTQRANGHAVAESSAFPRAVMHAMGTRR